MVLPYKIATLLYCFNDRDDVLLLHRAQNPNKDLWSPCGGKLHTDEGESPHACACREAEEEMGLKLQPRDLHLTGIITEQAYEKDTHWLLFLFEVKPRLREVPPPIREGTFAFIPINQLSKVPLPKTDIEQIWPLFWRHRGGFFAAHCRVLPNGENEWTIEEENSQPRSLMD
ncbi:MAG: hydrolase [Verrucomicrobiales bacterium]|nr:hydrolase [Verrucomicrobiales bacterium]